VNIIKSLIVNCFDLINQRKKQQLLDEIQINKQVATKIIDTLKNDGFAFAGRSNLTPDQKELIGQVMRVAMRNEVVIEERVRQVNTNQFGDQIEGLKINHDDIKNRINTMKVLQHILGEIDRPLGPTSASVSTWLSANDFILARNKQLTDKLVRETEVERQIHNQQSNLDDYADLSQEQPSHMDPED
jgi:hypothetical protein